MLYWDVFGALVLCCLETKVFIRQITIHEKDGRRPVVSRGGATRVPINVQMCTNLHYIEGYKERFDELECS